MEFTFQNINLKKYLKKGIEVERSWMSFFFIMQWIKV